MQFRTMLTRKASDTGKAMNNGQKWSHRNMIFFVVLCLMGLLALFSSTMSKSPVLPLFTQALWTPDYPEYFLGIVFAASTFPGIIISLPAGTLSDRLGRRKVLRFSGLIFATAPFLYLFVVNPVQLALVRFYHGFATAIFGPVANAAIADRFPRSRGEKISIFSSVTFVGRFLAPLIGSYLLLVTASNYHELYFVVGVAGVMALLVSFGLPGREKEVGGRIGSQLKKPSAYKDWREVASTRSILTVSLVEAAEYYSFGAFEPFVVLYAKSLGLDLFLIGIIALSEPLTVFAVKPLMGRLSDRIGRRKPIRAGLILSGFSLIALPLTLGFYDLIFVSAIYGIGFSMVTSSTPPFVAELCRKEVYGSAMGFLSTMMDVGQALGPIVTGLLLGMSFGNLGSFMHLGIVLFVAFLIFSAGFRKVKDLPEA